jgi:hypothetical protein
VFCCFVTVRPDPTKEEGFLARKELRLLSVRLLVMATAFMSFSHSRVVYEYIFSLAPASAMSWEKEHQQKPREEQHCALWQENQDKWWQDHPDWRVSTENDSHLCFAPMDDQVQAEYYRALHRRQFHDTNNCTDIYQRHLIGTGF